MTTQTSGTPSRLLAVDGPSLVHRAFHAYGPRDGKDALTTRAGHPVWATYGFFALLAGICEKVAPTHLLVGFDSEHSLRAEAYPEYKAQRSEKAPELHTQMGDVREILTSLNVATSTPRGLEADDVMASAAHRAEQAGWECVVATSDRDSFGLVTQKVTVFRLKNGLDNAVRITPEKLVELYGIRPDQYLEYAALRGDTSDNLPGVLGIGEKTAAKLLAVTDVESALADLELAQATIGKATGTKLHAGADTFRRNVKLMGLQRTVPVDLSATALGAVSAERVAEVLAGRELPSLVKRTTTALRATRPAEPVRSEQGTLMDVAVAAMSTPQSGTVNVSGSSLRSLPDTIPGLGTPWPATL